ncbi:MAG: phosphate ABC transporter permease PstA [Candidatus Cloacimonetes bacterium]|nr:phosphate ABC transporter permease PstA [Candidatus Cloacimonadota bacterium]MDD4156324.1 phosphate ABC transporter permease PstA [Candidatus Cloacimonadota bacterium]
MTDYQFNKRILLDKIFKYLLILMATIILIPLFLILYFLFSKGIQALNWNFFYKMPAAMGDLGGGIANAIVGTIILILTASIIAIPIGILVGIFLAEYKDLKLSYWVKISCEILQGTPSIVIGIVAWSWIVKPMGIFSAFSGGIALALMMLPIIIRSVEETIKLIPLNLKEASLSLGVPYYKTILKVILPTGLSSIISGILLSISRIAGETAPLIFTAFGNPFMSTNLFRPIESMPLLIFRYASSPFPNLHNIAWGASFSLVMFILILNLISKGVSKKWKIKY